LVSHDKRAIRVQADAVGSPESVGKDFCLRSIFADFQQGAVMCDKGGLGMARRLGLVEVIELPKLVQCIR